MECTGTHIRLQYIVLGEYVMESLITILVPSIGVVFVDIVVVAIVAGFTWNMELKLPMRHTTD